MYIAICGMRRHMNGRDLAIIISIKFFVKRHTQQERGEGRDREKGEGKRDGR
jgi:hypothetical protein